MAESTPIYPTIKGIPGSGYNRINFGKGIIILSEDTRQIFFGYCLDVLLYGFLTAQVYLYYLAFPNDKKISKAAVCFVYVVGSIQTAFALRDFFVLFCGQLGEVFHGPTIADPSNVHRFGFTWLTVPTSSTLVAVTVQLFYALRIYMLSSIKSVTIIVTILALVQLGCGILSTVFIYYPSSVTLTVLGPISGFLGNILWGLTGALCDLVIAIFMFIYISKQTRRQTTRATQQSLIKIKRLLLETGLLTAVAATTYAIFVLAVGGTAFAVPGLLLSKLYGNSMLALLNNRVVIEKGRYAIRPAEFSLHETDVSVTTT